MFNDLKGKTALLLSRHGEIDIDIARSIAQEGCNMILASGQPGSRSIAARIEAEFDIQVMSLTVGGDSEPWQEVMRRRARAPEIAINLIDGSLAQSVREDEAGWLAATAELQEQLKTIRLIFEAMKAGGGVIVNCIKPADQHSEDEVGLAVLHSGLTAFVKTVSSQYASDRVRIVNVFAGHFGKFAASQRRAKIARLYKASPLAISLAGASDPEDDEQTVELIKFLVSDRSHGLSGATLKVNQTERKTFQEW